MTSTTLTKPLCAESREAFLAFFEARYRSTIMNAFLHPPRHGVTDPACVVAGVKAALQEQVASAWSKEAEAKHAAYLLTLVQHPDEALRFAEYAVGYVFQPAEQREADKRAKQAVHVAEWMSNQAPSEPQMRYLRSLGHQGEVNSKLHACQLIEHLKAQQQNGGRHNG